MSKEQAATLEFLLAAPWLTAAEAERFVSWLPDADVEDYRQGERPWAADPGRKQGAGQAGRSTRV